jgi:hypothetical protein
MLGTNSTRGSIAEMLGDLVITDKSGERSELIAQAAPSLVRDPSPGVEFALPTPFIPSCRRDPS